MPGTGDQFGDEKDRASWKIGDVILRNVAGKVCRFRCIDDDYQDGSGNYGKRALFLAECVIRSDVESTYEAVSYTHLDVYKRQPTIWSWHF